MSNFTINISGGKTIHVVILQGRAEILRSEPFKRLSRAIRFANQQSKHLARNHPTANITINNQTESKIA